jgi:hypothetical protein
MYFYMNKNRYFVAHVSLKLARNICECVFVCMHNMIKTFYGKQENKNQKHSVSQFACEIQLKVCYFSLPLTYSQHPRK